MKHYFWVGFSVFLLWALVFFYICWYRSHLIRNRLLSLFDNPATLLSETVSKDKEILLQQVGNIFGYTQPKDNIAVFIFRILIPGAGGRYKYYLGVEMQGLNLEHNLYAGVYGSGFAVGHYSDPYSLNKKSYPLKEFRTELNIPRGYAIVEVNRENIVVFYELPDFFGYGKMAEISEWLKCM